MKKIRMMVCAAILLTIVGGALAFKVPGMNAYACKEIASGSGIFQCKLVDRDVDPSGFSIEIEVGAISSFHLEDLDCGVIPNCNNLIHYSIEQ